MIDLQLKNKTSGEVNCPRIRVEHQFTIVVVVVYIDAGCYHVATEFWSIFFLINISLSSELYWIKRSLHGGASDSTPTLVLPQEASHNATGQNGRPPELAGARLQLWLWDMGRIPKSWSLTITHTLLPNYYTPPNTSAMSLKMKQEQGGEKTDRLDKANQKKFSRKNENMLTSAQSAEPFFTL